MSAINFTNSSASQQALNFQTDQVKPPQSPDARKVFDQFVGQTFYGQMLKALRSTTGKPAYMHGGQAEEMFRNRLDEIMADQLSETHAKDFSGPMFEQFVGNMNRPK